MFIKKFSKCIILLVDNISSGHSPGLYCSITYHTMILTVLVVVRAHGLCITYSSVNVMRSRAHRTEQYCYCRNSSNGFREGAPQSTRVTITRSTKMTKYRQICRLAFPIPKSMFFCRYIVNNLSILMSLFQFLSQSTTRERLPLLYADQAVAVRVGLINHPQ